MLFRLGETDRWFTWSIALMIEAVSTSETSVNFYETTRRNISERSHLHAHHRDNMKSQHFIWTSSIETSGRKFAAFTMHTISSVLWRKESSMLANKDKNIKKKHVVTRLVNTWQQENAVSRPIPLTADFKEYKIAGTLQMVSSELHAAPTHRSSGLPPSQSQESRYGWRSVSQSVLVSSPFWDSWPDFSVLYIYDHIGLSPIGAPSLTRGWICHLSKSLSCKNIYIVINS
jgi:hypothetical protein